MSRIPISLADCYRFFVPLLLMTELNMISKSVIHAFLARTAEPDIVLAAFNTSFTFYYTVASATEITTLVCISYLDSRRSLRHLVGFMSVLLSVPLALSLAVAFTPAGDWLYGTVFGASDRVVAQAREATWVFCFSAPVLVLRGVAFALLMIHRRTLFISASTLVRVISLAASLVVWPLVLDGAAIGAAALVTCMLLETVFAWSFARRHQRALTPECGELPPYPRLWGFSWPLMLNQASDIGVVFVVNMFLGRLANADLALAAFGVAHGLVSLLFSPVRNLAQTAQTLVASRADARVLLAFTLQLAAGFAVIALVLFHTPLQGWVLAGAMGLGPELTAYCSPAVKIAFAMALFWALAALFRGLLAKARRTTLLAATGVLRLLAVAAVGAVTLLYAGANGAVVGLAAWILAYAFESAVLGWGLRRLPEHGTWPHAPTSS